MTTNKKQLAINFYNQFNLSIWYLMFIITYSRNKWSHFHRRHRNTTINIEQRVHLRFNTSVEGIGFSGGVTRFFFCNLVKIHILRWILVMAITIHFNTPKDTCPRWPRLLINTLNVIFKYIYVWNSYCKNAT